MYSKEDAIAFADSMRNSLKIMNSIGFADMNITPPDIDFYPDHDQFFNPQAYEIHIGVYGILDLFHPEDEAEFMSALNYVRGHEEQHCRSTPSKPYALAINKAIETVLEYIQEKEEGFKRRFKNEADYELVADRILPQKGIYISWEMVRNIMAGIANSLEDGRIERIRANRFHGFEVLRQVFRGKFWENDPENYPLYADMTAADKLMVITNQILCLSTCQLYQKGFVSAYAGTDLLEEIQQYHPYIGAAVMSGRCRGLINPMREIAKLLAPYIHEVCKMSYTDVKMKEAFEKFIKSLIERMLDDNNADTVSELSEDTDEGSMNSTFPISDLVITLDDETFDKLEKNTNNSNKSNASGGGIMIKREHPKEDATGKGNSNGPQKENKENGGSNSSSQNSKGNSSGDKNEEKPNESLQENQNSGEEPSNFGNLQQNNLSSQTGKAKEAKHVGQDAMEAAKAEVEKAMMEAAKEARAESETNIDTINSHAAASRSRGYKESFDTADPISPEEMKDICDFIEFKRQYKVTDPLPAVLNARGKTLHRKNEQYFKSLSTPNITFIDSGSIDPSRIYGLAMGDTDIFMKQGKDKKFDGCVYMLQDNSGSMAGKKREEACKAAAVIEEGFKGLIPLKIVAFDYHGSVIHEVIKEWDENLRKNCCWNFYKKGREGMGNEDGYDIQIATRELLARPERKKMLLVLSDGAPGDYNLCREAIRAARKAGIHVHGIYFEESGYDANTFEKMYEKDYVICQLDELDSHLQSIMKRFSRS